MSTDPTRRFTDREVALVIKSASEIDERSGSGVGGGLSIEDLREIAAEVGISPAAVDRAVARLDRGGSGLGVLQGAPVVRKAARAVPSELGREAVARLIEVVDERTDSTGTISEALGSVRWTSSDRFKSSLVSITPRDGETKIQVVEKAQPRLRMVVQWMPVAWSAMVGVPIVGALGLGAAATAGGVALTFAVGAAAGRGVWKLISERSARRVDRLATVLSDEARHVARPGSAAGPRDPSS